MKKTGLRKAAALTAAAAMCLSLPCGAAIANSTPRAAEDSIVAPANIIISATDNYLDDLGAGVLNCYGATQVPAGYTAYVKVELQQLDGSWSTIKSWSSKESLFASVDKNYAVSTSYSYRLKITHKAYNSSGNLIETITKYSNIV